MLLSFIIEGYLKIIISEEDYNMHFCDICLY